MQEKSYDTIKEEIRRDFIKFFEQHYGDRHGMRKKFADDIRVLPQTISDILNKHQYVSLEVLINLQLYHEKPFTWTISKGFPQKLTL